MSHQAADRRVTGDPLRSDDHECTILHVDMDAFFAAVEVRRRPELAGRPMMVAGPTGRGVVLSATYEARAFGVRSAMPTAQALARCPGIAHVPPDHDAYRTASVAVMRLLGEFTAVIEPLSVDEAFLDVSGAGRTGGRPVRIAMDIRRRIAAELGLTATVGMSSTKFVAKLASSLAKPDGLLVVPPASVHRMLRPLPVRALWGVGPKTADRLLSVGIATVGDVVDAGTATLASIVGRSHAAGLKELANGRDARPVRPRGREVTIGAERTFDTDLRDPVAVRRALLLLSGAAGRRARRAGVAGRTVVLKARFDDFTTVTRSESCAVPVDADRDVAEAALRAWDRLGSGRRPIRLLGVRLDGLVRADHVARQLSLEFGDDHQAWDRAQHVIDAIAARFPAGAPRPASVLDPAGGRTATASAGAAGGATSTVPSHAGERDGPCAGGDDVRSAGRPSHDTANMRRGGDRRIAGSGWKAP